MGPEVRVARIVEAIGGDRRNRLSRLEAAEGVGMSERHFRAPRERNEAAGAKLLIGRRRGRAAARAAPVSASGTRRGWRAMPRGVGRTGASGCGLARGEPPKPHPTARNIWLGR